MRSPSRKQLTRAWLLALLSVSSAVLGQTALLERREPGRGINLPPTSTALSNEAPSIQVNPAGLSGVGSLQLFYGHERSIGRDQVGDALFLAQPLGPLALGFSVEWMRFTLGDAPTAATASYRRTGWGLSFGSPNLSLGLTWNFYGADANPSLDALTSLDLGAVGRPNRYLSVAGVIRNVDARSRGQVAFNRRYELGLAVRPFGTERLSLAGDWHLPDDFTVRRSTFAYTVQAGVVSGIRLGAGVAHDLETPSNVRFQVGLTLDSPFAGVTYAAGRGDDGMHHVGLVRLSTERYPAIAGRKRVALFDLADLLQPASSPALALLGLTPPDPFLRAFEMLSAAAVDPQLSGIVLKLDSLPQVGWGRVEELRQAVLRIRQGGKTVIAVLMNAEDPEYFLASAADHIFIAPQAGLLVNGLSARLLFLGETMEKLGVHWDVARVGAYKNAPDQLTRRDISPEQRETIEAYLDSQMDFMERSIQQVRPTLTVPKQREARAEGLLTPRRAKALGLVDDVLDPEAIEERVQKLLPGAMFDPAYAPFGERSDAWGIPTKIAVVPVLGNIAGGKSRQDPLGMSEVAGAETVVRALNQAAEDPSVAAIVVRVDSPGGEGLASDLMYRAVLEAKKKKPVIASMGDVAASGGYYASMGADEIFASPTTITGSIGVFFLKPALGGLAEKLGVHSALITRGPVADLTSLYSPWTDAERAIAQRWVNDFYDDFITEVAQSRKLDKAKVDAVARGRVWSGIAAKQHGLVDQLGGMHEALAAAQRRAGLEGKPVVVGIYGGPAGLFASLGGEPGVKSALEAVLPAEGAAPRLPDATRALLREAGLPSMTTLTPGLHAELPFRIDVR